MTITQPSPLVTAPLADAVPEGWLVRLGRVSTCRAKWVLLVWLVVVVVPPRRWP